MFALSENHRIIVFSRIYPTASDAEKCPKSWKCFWQFRPQLHFAEREGVVKIGITCDLRITRFFFNFENAWHSLVGLRHCDTGPSKKSKTRLLLLGVYSVISHQNINFGLLLLDMIMVTFLLTLLCNVVSSIYSLALIQRWQWNQKSISAPIWQ